MQSCSPLHLTAQNPLRRRQEQSRPVPPTAPGIPTERNTISGQLARYNVFKSRYDFFTPEEYKREQEQYQRDYQDYLKEKEKFEYYKNLRREYEELDKILNLPTAKAERIIESNRDKSQITKEFDENEFQIHRKRVYGIIRDLLAQDKHNSMIQGLSVRTRFPLVAANLVLDKRYDRERQRGKFLQKMREKRRHRDEEVKPPAQKRQRI